MSDKNIGAKMLICYSGDAEAGSLSRLIYDGSWRVEVFPVKAATSVPQEQKPILLTAEPSGIFLLDPVKKTIAVSAKFPVDASPTYAYLDPVNARMWYVNDGDKETGNDTFNCGDQGASVTVVSQQGVESRFEKNICVGRGHHVVTFIGPSDCPGISARAFVSNLVDGTLSVIGNDEADATEYLKVIATINLFDAQGEETTQPCIPNNAFPHGMVYSAHTGKLYNLNNGYHSIAVIDPIKHIVEQRIPMPVSSNLLGSLDGKFLIGKGVDRKSDSDHVIGQLPIFDIDQNRVVDVIKLPDVYPSTYRFNPSGNKLYVTTAATGKGAQRDHIKTNLLYVFDTSHLPKMPLIKVLEVGECQAGRRPMALTSGDLAEHYIFVPNLTDGTLTVIREADDSIVATLELGHKMATEFSFSFWQSNIYGA